MTADALNSLESRIGDDIAGLKRDVAGLKRDVAGLKRDVAGLKRDVAGLKHDVHLLNVKVDVNQRTTEEKLDLGFRQVLEYLEKR